MNPITDIPGAAAAASQVVQVRIAESAGMGALKGALDVQREVQAEIARMMLTLDPQLGQNVDMRA
jgi:hypothetical protein